MGTKNQKIEILVVEKTKSEKIENEIKNEDIKNTNYEAMKEHGKINKEQYKIRMDCYLFWVKIIIIGIIAILFIGSLLVFYGIAIIQFLGVMVDYSWVIPYFFFFHNTKL